jgi:tetratricopeptide (TPR) repeat protein
MSEKTGLVKGPREGWLREGLRPAILYIALVVPVLLIYMNALRNGFVWDDEILIVNSHLVKSWSNVPELFAQSRFQLQDQGMLGSGYYRPLISLSCVIDYSLWGLKPWGYHLTNIIFHCLNVLLFFHFFRKIFRNDGVVFLASLLYAVSPIHTNAVSYIMGRTDLFATLFFLSGMLMYRSFRVSVDGGGRARRLIAALVFFCLALLCKESAVTLPLIVVLYDVCFTDQFKKDGFRWRNLSAYIPYAVILVAYFFIRRLVIPEGLDFAIHSFSDLAHRLATISVSILLYFKLLLFPLQLSYERSVEVVHSFASPLFLFSVLGLALSLFLMKLWWDRDRRKLFCLLWFFIILAPTSNIVPVFPDMASSHLYAAEHFMYLPSMGLFILAVSILSTMMPRGKNLHAMRRRQAVFLSLCFIVALSFSALTIRRNMDWRDSLTFFKTSVAMNPNSVRMMSNLGVEYAGQMKYQEALELFESAAAIRPDNAGAYNNIAGVYEDTGRLDKAEQNRRKAISIDERNVKARIGLGKLLMASGRLDEAQEEFALLTKWYPGLSLAHHELGRMAAARGDGDEALAQFQKALENSPSPEVVLNSMGIIYAGRGDLSNAASYFERAVMANPGFYEARVNLANTHYARKAYGKAMREYEKAIAAGAVMPGLKERVRELRAIVPK